MEKHSSLHSLFWDSQPLPAYQYFENVRNFLVAVEELHLPAFEASVFERVNLNRMLTFLSAVGKLCERVVMAMHLYNAFSG